MKSLKLILALAVALLLSACGPKLDGTYSHPSGMVNLTFKSNGKVALTGPTGEGTELNYQISDNEIKIKAPQGQDYLALTLLADGSLRQDATGEIFMKQKVDRVDANALAGSIGSSARDKVRSAQLQKAVLNNLRQLSAAADQFYLETGMSTASYDHLVGPGKYVTYVTPVDGEDYRSIVFQQGGNLVVTTRSGIRLSYGDRDGVTSSADSRTGTPASPAIRQGTVQTFRRDSSGRLINLTTR